ncbi:hypothetical protein [Limisphaera sp. VF-2]|jgi:hypothetical protein|uniref:hypothetical protein n=1 Tax=Limisphaera sp. VF-2 TaxID=3400418 RepID=UPI002560E552|nr:hypothetical protein [Limisphaera sp.]
MNVNLTEEQRKQVAQWLNQGAKLSEVQDRLAKEFGIRLTYMEVRLLVDDLKLQVKDPEPETTEAAKPAGRETEKAGAGPRRVRISVDELTRPGAVISGKVTFSDGQTADWYLDQMGRLGLATEKPGYRPSAEDIEEFQRQLDQELAKYGF